MVTRVSPSAGTGSGRETVVKFRHPLKIRRFAVPVAVTLAALGVSGCGATAAPPHPSETHSPPAAEPSPAAPSEAPVLAPGGSASFSTGSIGDSQDSKMTWEMGAKVATESDSSRHGYQDIAFNLTIRNDSAERITHSPDVQSYMVWRGTDGRTDNTLAHTAATTITPQAHGIDGENLSLITGGLPAHGYAKGYMTLLVPTAPGAIVVMDPGMYKPVLVINYGKLASEQLKDFRRE